MATFSGLYNLFIRSSQRLVDSTESVSSTVSWEITLPSLPPLPTYDDLPETIRTEVEETMANANILINQTYSKLDETFHINQHYAEAEAQIGDWSEAVGLGHIPPSQLLELAVVTLTVGCILTVLGCRLQRRRRHRQMYGHNAFPPYAKVGTLETAIAHLTGSQLPWFYQQCAAETQSSVFRLRQAPPSTPKGAPMVVAVGDLVTAKEILRDAETIKPERVYSSITRMTGGTPNIISSEGQVWKTSRKAISPAFLKKHLDRMHHVCKDETEQWISEMLKPCIENKQDFDVGHQMELLTLSIISKVAFDYRMNPKEGAALLHELNIMSKAFTFDEVNRPIVGMVGILTPSFRRAKVARTRVHDFAKKILNIYRKKVSKTAAAGSNSSSSTSSSAAASSETCPPREDTIISCIARCKKYDDDSHRVADIVAFLYASIYNTAYSLAWTLFELAKNPEESQKLQNALNGNDDSLAQEMLKDVLREGMRLRPPTPGIGMRTVGKDFYMKDESIVIPKGSCVFFPSLVITRFGIDDAESFRPSRWRDHPDKSFLLFSTGPRNCIGQSLALAEITWVLSRICAKYDLTVTEEGTAEYTGTIKCVGTRLLCQSKD
jgi:cytochrome P450